MASPIPSDSSTDFWINPCGYEEHEESVDIPEDALQEVLDEVIRSANTAHLQAISFKNEILKNLNVPEDSLAFHKYDWLEIPPAGEEIFEATDRDSALRYAFYLLQKFGIALQQMLQDQEENDVYLEMALDSVSKLKEMLCALQSALLAMNIERSFDATADVMDDELRSLSGAKLHVRDYIFMRDYADAALYVKKWAEFLARG